MPISPEQVLDALRSVMDPDLHTDIVTLGFVQDIEIDGGKVAFKVELTTPACPMKDVLKEQSEQAVLGIEGIDSVEIEMTARVAQQPLTEKQQIPGVRQTIAIASGKGGVGKSTVTVNLALALAAQGARVGILDADVYGPSVPLMMGCESEQPNMSEEKKILPIEAHGIKMMSIGFLLPEGQAVLWRGPMVAGTVKQLLSDVDWGELDYLLIDLPPGTGDSPMTLAQTVPLTGVVLVTTPHGVAAKVAGKSAALFQRLDAPILGVVENMGTYVCSECGHESRLFSGTPGAQLAAALETPFLGSVPLDPQVGEAADRGMPSVVAHPDTPQAEAFNEIAGRIAQQVSIRAHALSQEANMGPSPN